jgi:hypothetical protein
MRHEIQGLRAVAVLLVVLFHLWPHRVPGGYVGVDVFFVISGFLITSLILREVDRTGRVDLARFWARRIRRLLPAAYVVLAASVVGVLTLTPRLVWQQFLGEILGAALYVENSPRARSTTSRPRTRPRRPSTTGPSPRRSSSTWSGRCSCWSASGGPDVGAPGHKDTRHKGTRHEAAGPAAPCLPSWPWR